MRQDRFSFRVCVLGAGAVGQFVGILLSRIPGVQVVFVARKVTVDSINEKGVILSSGYYGEISLREAKAEDNLSSEIDLLVLATKAPYLLEAVFRVSPHLARRASVVPLLNGLEHVAFLRDYFRDSYVFAGTIGQFEAYLDNQGYVRHLTKKPARIEIGVHQSWMTRMKVALFLDKAGIITDILRSEKDVIWSKLVRLNAFGCLTAFSQKTLGEVLDDDDLRGKLDLCVREASRVAIADGASPRFVSESRVNEEIRKLPRTLTSSLARDVALGNISELDAIAGAIVRAGIRYDVLCPTIEEMIDRISSRGNK